MTVSVFPRVVREGLVIDYDLADSRSYVTSENLILNSEQITTGAPWGITGSTTVTPNAIAAPNGTLTADQISNVNSILQDVTIPAGATITASVYVKSVSSTSIGFTAWWIGATPHNMQLTMNPITGAFSSAGVNNAFATLLGSSIEAVGNGWYRISVSGRSTAGYTTLRFEIYNNSGAATSYYMWGAQVDKSRTPSAYVATTGSTITRGATINNTVSALYPGTINGTTFTTEGQGGLYFNELTSNFVSMYTLPDAFWNAASWSVSAWFRPDTTSKSFGDNAILGHGTAASSNGLHLGIRNAFVHFGFFGNDTSSGNVITSNQWYHIVWVFDNAQKQKLIYLNGALLSSSVLTGGTGYSGTGTNTEIGRYPWGGATHYALGTIGRVQIYNRPIGPSEVSQIYGSLAGRYLL